MLPGLRYWYLSNKGPIGREMFPSEARFWCERSRLSSIWTGTWNNASISYASGSVRADWWTAVGGVVVYMTVYLSDERRSSTEERKVSEIVSLGIR